MAIKISYMVLGSVMTNCYFLQNPGTSEMIQLLPEEEREEQFIAIYTDYPLSTGTPESTGASFIGPDRVLWRGQTWRVVRVRDWEMFGYYQAYAVLMHEVAA